MKNFLTNLSSQLTMTCGAVVRTVTVATQVKAVKNMRQILGRRDISHGGGQ